MDLSTDNMHILVEAFYAKVWKDELIGPVFAHVDFEKHLPKMVNFWSTVIFSNGTYAGQPFPKHVPLKIGKPHFERWQKLFGETVHEHFKGEMADKIIERAGVIGMTFQYKLETIHNRIV